MSIRKLLNRFGVSTRRSRSKTSTFQRRRAIMESLEDRRLLAVFPVTNLNDSGAGSLRAAIVAANTDTNPDADIVQINVNGTINVNQDGTTGSALSITDPDGLTINGPTTGSVEIHATATALDQFRVFNIADIADTAGAVTFSKVTISGGKIDGDGSAVGEPGGAIRTTSSGVLTINQSIITGNAASNGGAIYSEYDGDVVVSNGSSITSNSAADGSGGAIDVFDGDVSVTDSSITANSSYGSGAGISSKAAAAVTVTNSNISGNAITFDYHGGAIYSLDGDVTIDGSSITGNTALGDGGALYSLSGDVSITNSTLDGNIADYGAGGAIFNYGSAGLPANNEVIPPTPAVPADVMTITDSVISNNSANYGDGGGVSNTNSTFTLTRSSITGNTSQTSGGGISNVGNVVVNPDESTTDIGALTVIDSTISGNKAGYDSDAEEFLTFGDGGGISTEGGPLTLTNSTVSGNQAAISGGGVYSSIATVDLLNTTLTDNTADSGGGITTNSNQDVSLINSIVANNIAMATIGRIGPDFLIGTDGSASGVITALDSLIGDNDETGVPVLTPGSPSGTNYIGTTASPVDPVLGPLQDNGGPTETHALVTGSPAINTGANPAAPSHDQRGIVRKPGAGDMGSFEVAAKVEGRFIAYGGATAGYGQDAIDTSKLALLPDVGATPSFANYTNYLQGLNRVVIDIQGLPVSTLSPADFEFHVGNTADTSSWSLLATAPTIGPATAGAGGADRVTLAWPNNTIKNQWLRVTVKANDNTGLEQEDVFYFGNQVGDVVGPTAQGQNVVVNATDVILTRFSQSLPVDSAAITSPHDVNRDGEVNAIDVIFVRFNQKLTGGLLMISPDTPA